MKCSDVLKTYQWINEYDNLIRIAISTLTAPNHHKISITTYRKTLYDTMHAIIPTFMDVVRECDLTDEQREFRIVL